MSKYYTDSNPIHTGLFENLIILVRADPIICGHSTEARNLAEAAVRNGIERVHLVTYPISTLQDSGLPLKPLTALPPYSKGIEVDRPVPIGDYKILDGRLGYAISGRIVDLIRRFDGPTMVMNLYIVPHGLMVMNAVRALGFNPSLPRVATVAEAVGSDITHVINNALQTEAFGTGSLVLSNFLEHDLPLAVSEYTLQLIVDAGARLDEAVGTQFEHQLRERVKVSYPAIDTSIYLNVEKQQRRLEETLAARGLSRDGYLLFLSRLARAKGVDDLILAYRASRSYGEKQLVICGDGPDSSRLQELAAGDPNIRFFRDVGDDEKTFLMHGCAMFCLPSKPRPEFTETFGIAVAEKMLAGGLGPVITTHTGGIPEATGDRCLYHEPGDVSDLTRAINEAVAMSLKQRQQLSEAAREYAMRFDRQQVLSNMFHMLGSNPAQKVSAQ